MLLLAGAAMASRRKTALLAAAALFVSSLVSLFDSLVLYGFSLYAVGYSRFVTLSLMSSMLCAVLVFRKSFYFAAVVSVALFASQSFMYGHHIKTGLSSLFVAHVAHLLSAALWFSALVLLMLDKSRLLIASRLATLSAWVLVPSAVFMVVQYDVLPPDGVWEFIISAKILLVSLTLAAGALNHSRSRKTPCDVAAIRNLVKFEVASLSLVIMLSVALSGTSPTRHETTKTTPAVQVSLDKEFDDGTRSTVKVVNTDSGLEITLVFKNRALETVDSLSWSISDGSLVLEGDFLRMNDHFHAVVQSPPLKNQTLEISGVFDTFTPVSMVLDLEENDVKK
jgi:hypothetical protein